MFRRNNPVSGLQTPENTMNELPLRASQQQAAPAAPVAVAPASPTSASTVQPLAPRPVAQTAPAAPKVGELPVSRFGGIPGVMPRRVGGQAEQTVAEQGLRKLIVGREISLSGDITACDILVVEGNIEATLRDGKHLEITEAGHFKGSVEIDEADIAGKFEGNLIVRGRLKLRSTGQVEGTMSYGELEVEAGGRLVGEIKVLGTAAKKQNQSQNSEARTPVAAEA